MPKEAMSPRERWLAVLNRQKPDRFPMDYWGTSEATDRLCAYLGCDFDEACPRLHIDTPRTNHCLQNPRQVESRDPGLPWDFV